MIQRTLYAQPSITTSVGLEFYVMCKNASSSDVSTLPYARRTRYSRRWVISHLREGATVFANIVIYSRWKGIRYLNCVYLLVDRSKYLEEIRFVENCAHNNYGLVSKEKEGGGRGNNRRTRKTRRDKDARRVRKRIIILYSFSNLISSNAGKLALFREWIRVGTRDGESWLGKVQKWLLRKVRV